MNLSYIGILEIVEGVYLGSTNPQFERVRDNSEMLVILPLVLLAILTYSFAIKPFNYWKDKNVKASKGIPFFGENFWVLMCMESFVEQVHRIYNLFSNERYFGVYFFTIPLLLVKSPDLVKELCVKNFDHFMNRMTLVPDHADDLFTRNSVSMKGEEWKNVRSTMSPVYTSSKMKVFFNQISHNADKLMDYILKNDRKIIELELKDLLSRFANDVMASNLYGLQIDSLKDRNNIFFEMAKKGTNISGYRKKFSILFYQLAPKISVFFRLPLAEKEVQSFFVNLIRDTIAIRKTQNISQPDLVGKLIQSTEVNEFKTNSAIDGSVVEKKNWRTKEIKNDLSITDIAALTFFAFIAGFEGISNVLCFVAHQLALNPDIQKRLINEVDENFSEHETPSYGKLLNMTYLDMVLSEGLRMWPFLPIVDRITTKKYTIQPERPDEHPLTLEPGSIILIPIIGLHYDPKYYEHPEKFDPERFSPVNRKTIKPYTYLPFGVGPRTCLGNRFALMEMKIILFKMLSHFEIIPIQKTEVPFKMNKQALGLNPINGYHLGLKRRSDRNKLK